MQFLALAIAAIASTGIVLAAPPSNTPANIWVSDAANGDALLGWVTTSLTPNGAFIVDNSTSNRLCVVYDSGAQWLKITGSAPTRSYNYFGLLGYVNQWTSNLDAGWIGIIPGTAAASTAHPYPNQANRYYDSLWSQWWVGANGQWFELNKQYGSSVNNTLMVSQSPSFTNWRLFAAKDAGTYSAGGPDCSTSGGTCKVVRLFYAPNSNCPLT